MARCDNIDAVDLDLVDVINTVLPFEKHIPGMNYCGPGTNLKKKLLPDGITKNTFQWTELIKSR